MHPALIVITIIGSILTLFLLLGIIAGSLVVLIFNHKDSLFSKLGDGKEEMKAEEHPEFDFQKDKEWWSTPNLFEYISIKSFDKKKISAYLHKENDSHLYIVFAHGYGGSPFEKARCLHDIYDHYHCNILTLEQRGQGKSEIKYSTMGYKEGKDLISWADYIVSVDPEAEIITFGESMGAATVLYGLEFGYNKNVLGVIEDCGYSSISKAYWFTSTYTFPKIIAIPGVIGTIPAFFVYMGMRVVTHSPLNAIRKKTIPVCFIHGDADQIVPYECYELFKKNINPETDATFESFPNAKHVAAYYSDRDRYLNILFTFIDKVRKARA